jgi:hypothetical protein
MHQQAARSLLDAHGRRTQVQLHLLPTASTTSPVVLHWLYSNCVVRRDYSSYGRIGSTSSTSHTVATSSLDRVGSTTIMSCAATTRLTTTAALPQLCRASGCLGTSRGSRDSSRHSSSTTSPTPRVRVPRHVARLVTRLVVDYFAYAARPVASARRVACRAPRCRLLRLRLASGCLDTSRGSSRGSSSTTSTTPRVRVPRHVARLITRLVA